jgi:hypothetical protein
MEWIVPADRGKFTLIQPFPPPNMHRSIYSYMKLDLNKQVENQKEILEIMFSNFQ